MSDRTPDDLFAGLDVDPALLQDALRHADEHAREYPPGAWAEEPGAPEPRALGGEVWIPEAEDLSSHTGSYRGGGLMEGGPPRVVWHTTEAPSGGGYFDAMDRVLTSKTAWSTVLYDPLTDRLGQYFPLNRSARALADPAGGVRTNRCGSVCIQIEVVAYASKPFTSYWKPGRNFAALMRAIRTWGVPDRFTQPQMPYPGPATDRSVSTWLNVAGHRSHQNVPENDHGDAGAIDTAAILAIGSKPPPPPGPDLTEHFMRLVRNNTQGSTFDKGFGAVYLVGPAVWQHVPTTEQLNALQLAWGPYVNVGDGDLAKMRDAYWTTMETLKGWFPASTAAPASPPFAD